MNTNRYGVIALFFAACGSSAHATTFINGDFETGDAAGWTIGGGYRASVQNAALNDSLLLPGGSLYNTGIASTHSSIVTPASDPNTGNGLNRVYSGNYSWRVEDTTFGGYASVISQRVNSYTDPNIFFAWAAVLEGAHGTTDSATMKISLRDLTQGDQLISREYNAASTGSGVDARFHYNASTNFYWTDWQEEQLALPADRIGHDFLLSVLGSDCQPTGHTGYVYLDGFGSTPPSDVPEPSTSVLAGAGLAMAALGLRRSRSS